MGLLSLLLICIVLYLLFSQTTFNPFSSLADNGEASQNAITFSTDKLIGEVTSLDSTLRDPFKPYLHQKKKKRVIRRVKRVVKKAPPKKIITPPAVKIDAILWGSSPVAIIKMGAKTEFAKPGQKYGDIVVEKITQESITVLKEGKSFVIKK